MRSTGLDKRGARCQAGAVRTLVISQHEAVRHQLVAYLGRSSALAVRGVPFSPGAILEARPDVLVLDLSQLGQPALRAALDSTRRIGAHVIALASMRDPVDERAVTSVGGLYRLKSAGADGLAETVRDVAARPLPPSHLTAAF
jgi:DNA-binding NarL/FixJ family response regulator